MVQAILKNGRRRVNPVGDHPFDHRTIVMRQLNRHDRLIAAGLLQSGQLGIVLDYCSAICDFLISP